MFLFRGLGILFKRKRIIAGATIFFIQGVGRECQMIIKEKAHLHRSLVVDKAVTLHRVMVGVVAIRACGVTHCRW